MLNSTCMRKQSLLIRRYTHPRPDPGADELTASIDRLSVAGLFLKTLSVP